MSVVAITFVVIALAEVADTSGLVTLVLATRFPARWVLLGVCAGTYGLLTAEGGTYGVPVLLAGVVAALAGLRLGGRRSLRTRYRPDPATYTGI